MDCWESIEAQFCAGESLEGPRMDWKRFGSKEQQMGFSTFERWNLQMVGWRRMTFERWHVWKNGMG